VVSKYRQYVHPFRHKTDRQNYDPQDRASTAASRGKNLAQHCVLLALPVRFDVAERWRTWITIMISVLVVANTLQIEQQTF